MKPAMGFLRVTVLAFGLFGPMVAWADVDELNRQVVQLYEQGKYREALGEHPVAHAVSHHINGHAGPEAGQVIEHVGHLAPGGAGSFFVAGVGHEFPV